jgi:hypothetical protein
LVLVSESSCSGDWLTFLLLVEGCGSSLSFGILLGTSIFPTVNYSCWYLISGYRTAKKNSEQLKI